MKQGYRRILCGAAAVGCFLLNSVSLSSEVSNASEKIQTSHTYGADITLDELITLGTAIKRADAHHSEPILVKAKVGSVCEKKGCWLSLVDESNQLRVTFKNYGFFVPPTIKGDIVLVEGRLQKTTLTLADTKHYIEDAGGDPNQVTEPITEYQMIATTVKTQ